MYLKQEINKENQRVGQLEAGIKEYRKLWNGENLIPKYESNIRT